MAYKSNVMIVRHGLLAKLVRLWYEGRLVDDIDHLPINLSPRQSKARGRCCIHKERAVWKYKMFPLLGFDMSDEKDELTPLSHYAKEALERRRKFERNIMCVMDEACSSCVQVNYEISNLCRGCVARTCYMNCPKNAIHFKSNGQAEINHDICISCGKCHESCPYHAIIYVPIPCEEACPVKAISKDEFGVEHIDEDKCIYCGKCMNACPFGAIFDISQVFDILEHIKNPEQKVVAMVAPAILSQYNVAKEQIYAAIKAIGFDEIIEVAYGADETTRTESAELMDKLVEGQHFMTTSCCPSYIQLVQKHIPEMQKYVSTTGSPMYYTAKYAREKFPGSITVFVGPCIAKRKEAMMNPDVDYVMTFEEVGSVLDGLDIEVEQVVPIHIDEKAYLESHGYAHTGGVANAVQTHLGKHVNFAAVSNLNRKNIALLKAYAKTGKCPNQFIEVMACEGGCVTGPVINNHKTTSQALYNKNLEELAKNYNNQ